MSASASKNDYRPCPEDRKPDRTVVIVGKSGNGKSTLANVIIGAYDGSEFDEESGPAGVTRGRPFRTALIPYGGKEFAVKVIDTIGYADTELSEETVLLALAELAYDCSEGIHQVFFVTNGRFTKEEQTTIDKMINVIFQPEVGQFSTLLRTCTPIRDLSPAHPATLAETTAKYFDGVVKIDPRMKVIRNCVMVDNPDPGNDYGIEKRKETRKMLVERIVSHRGKYIPPSFPQVKAKIGTEMKAKRDVQDKIDSLEKAMRDEKGDQQKFQLQMMQFMQEIVEANTALAAKMASIRRQGPCTIL